MKQIFLKECSIDWNAARKEFKKASEPDQKGWKLSDSLEIIKHDCLYYPKSYGKTLNKSDKGSCESLEGYKGYKSRRYAFEAAVAELDPINGVSVYFDVTIFA